MPKGSLTMKVELSDDARRELDSITTDVANLCELERSGWIVLEQRIRALEEQETSDLVERDDSRRYLALSDELDQALRMRGITGHIGLRFKPHPTSARRWLLDFAEGYTPGWPPRTLKADAEIRALKDEHKAELRQALAELERMRGELRAAVTAGERIGEQLDAARASAIEWANTPIHRLLTAYNDARGAGRVNRLDLWQALDSSHWYVEWFHGRTKHEECRPTLDEACTAAAEQIEAA